MTMKEALVVTIILQIIAAGNAIITTPPADTSICYGGLATFHCGSDRNDIVIFQWHISPDDLSLQEKVISTDTNITNEYATTTLSIIGLPVNDSIHIVCTAVTSSFDVDSGGPALLTVADIPPVEDLTIEFTDTVMNVTWSKPSCLPVYYTYSITITDDNNQTLTTNTTDPLYTMPVWSNCTTNYTVSVTVIDTGYTHKQSLPSVGKKTRNNTEEVYVDLIKWKLVFSNPNQSYINVTFKINKQCNERSAHDNFIERVLPFDRVRMVPLLEYANRETEIGNYVTDNFVERFLGELSISPAANDKRASRINISTFNVQDLRVTNKTHSGTIVITCKCVFAVNSFADGCNVTIQSSQYNTSIVIQKEKNENSATYETVLPEEGFYIFQVFDIIDGITDTSRPAINMSKTISYSNVDNPSGINDNYISTSSFSVFESTSTTFSPTQPSSSITVSNVESSISTKVIVSGVCCSIFILFAIIGFVLFLTTIIRHQQKKKGAFDTRKDRVIVGIYETDNNEYVERQSSVDASVSVDTSHAPVTAQSTQQHEEDNPYHVPMNDFLYHSKLPVEVDSEYNNRISPLASQERHSENFESVVNQDSNFSSHVYSNTKCLNGKQSSSPYEKIPPKHRHMSSDSATDQQSSIPAGPMLNKNQYAELTSNSQRPKPPIPDPRPPPVYSSIIQADDALRMTVQLSEEKEPIAMQETQHDRNTCSAKVGLSVNLDLYNGMNFAGSVFNGNEDYSHNTATTVFNENKEEQEPSLHQRITCPEKDGKGDVRDKLVSNTPDSSGTQMITKPFQSPFLNTYQKQAKTISHYWNDQLINDTDIRDIDITECYSDVDASHSQMVYLFNNDYVKSRESSDLVVFCRSRTIFQDDVVEDHECIEVVSIGVKDNYPEEEESERNVTIITAAFEKQKPSVCEFIQWTLAILTCIVFKLKSFFHQGYVFDGGGKKDKIRFSNCVKEFQLFVFDGGGLLLAQNHYVWWYTFRKLLYDKAVKSDCTCLFLFLLLSAVYFHLFNPCCTPLYICSSKMSLPSSSMIIQFKKRKKKIRPWKPSTIMFV